MRTAFLGVVLMAVSGLPGFTLPVPGASFLPAPLFFIMDGQVYRLARDGFALSRVTDEPFPVESFDVSPVTGHVVLVAGNSLILLERNGERRVLLSGPELPPAETGVEPFNDRFRVAGRIATPRWSPDGGSIAFVHDGLIAMELPSGVVTTVHSNNQLPPPGENWDALVFRSVEEWSPDGERILVTTYNFPLTSLHHVSMGIKELSGHRGLFHVAESAVSFGWSGDGQELYLGNPDFGGQSSLCRLGPPDWSCLLLGEEVPARNYWFYSHPCVAHDGDVSVFVSMGQDPVSSQGWYTLYRVDHRGFGMTALREERFTVSDALWAPSGIGVLLVDDQQRLSWIPAGDGRIRNLPVSGASMLRWGH